jgi:hypothetical protein
MKLRALLIPVLLASCGGADELVDESIDELRTNRDPNRLVVWTNNIENMIFDWRALVNAMRDDPLRPDIFLVQQVTDGDEMDRLARFMSDKLGVHYTGIVAKEHPRDHRFQGQVIPRPTVTTGIVFRTARFELVDKSSFMPWGDGFRNQVQRCDVRADHSGYETLRLKLFDKRAEKNVVAISLRHWTFHPCSSKNVRDLDGRLGRGAELHIVGGDFNDRLFEADGSYACWYRQMNRGIGESRCASDEDLGFTDPMFASCDGDRACVKKKAGIDAIFVRRSDGVRARTSNFDILTFEEAGKNYSQHRARRAYVYYE